MTNLHLVLAEIKDKIGGPETWDEPVEMRDSLALCALNSAHSLRANSKSVRNVLARYRAHRVAAGGDPDSDSGPDLMRVMDAEGGPRTFALEILQTRATFPKTGRLRSEAIYDAMVALETVGITSTAQLRASANAPTAEQAWRSVKGLGRQSWDYLLMNAGDGSRTKPDVMVRRFLERAISEPVPPRAATELITKAAKELGVEVRALDRAIWLYESPDNKMEKEGVVK